MSNIQDVDLPRHAWDTPPSLLIVFSTPSLQAVDAYVRTLGQSRSNQTKRVWQYSMSMEPRYKGLIEPRFDYCD